MEELYNRYRPAEYNELLGNELAVKSVLKELEAGTHVFLLTGIGGSGKTTLARLMAKTVGGTDMTIHEMNSAETRGIDSAREIMEALQYAPISGTADVYIMDEFHAQTSQAQQAFLKILEECPSYAYFFLCTTDPQKLIKPLVTRCSVVNLKPLETETMVLLLRKVAHREARQMALPLFTKIAELSGGSSRKALKLLASVLYLESDEERETYLNANQMTDDNPDAIQLCRALFRGADWATLSGWLSKIDMSQPESVRQLVMSYMNSVLVKGIYNVNVVAAMQAFSSTDTYKNGKFAIMVACLDYLTLCNS